MRKGREKAVKVDEIIFDLWKQFESHQRKEAVHNQHFSVPHFSVRCWLAIRQKNVGQKNAEKPSLRTIERLVYSLLPLVGLPEPVGRSHRLNFLGNGLVIQSPAF
jgi:hypothetical protein